MTIIYEVYIGPYIECKTKKGIDTIEQNGEEIEVERIEPDCSPLLEDNGFLEVFQPLSGSHIEAVQRDREIDVWLPNWCDSPGLLFDPRDVVDIRQLSLTSLAHDPTRLVAQLENRHVLNVQWRKLLDFYGGEINVSILWGVINTAN